MVEDTISRRIFTTADASRIAGVNPASARRWVTGYSYRYKGSTRTRAPQLGPSAGEVEGVLLMSFLDLIEIQMAVSLRNRKITWPKIGKAAELFRRQWGSAHPFALQRFRSDSQTILAEFGKEIGDPYVLDVATNQFVFDALIEQSLFDVLDFREDELRGVCGSEIVTHRWWSTLPRVWSTHYRRLRLTSQHVGRRLCC